MTTTSLCKGYYTASENYVTVHRATLYTILAGLTVLNWAEKQKGSSLGTIPIESTNTQALRISLRKGPTGVKTATQEDYDVIMEMKALLQHLKTL
jgi:hypothetical protein